MDFLQRSQENAKIKSCFSVDAWYLKPKKVQSNFIKKCSNRGGYCKIWKKSFEQILCPVNPMLVANKMVEYGE